MVQVSIIGESSSRDYGYVPLVILTSIQSKHFEGQITSKKFPGNGNDNRQSFKIFFSFS